jgi:hypothetical protein
VADSTLGYSDIIYAITYGNGKFVAVSHQGEMAYSADGITWTAVADSKFDGYPISAITYGNGRFGAGGRGRSSGTMAYSADGVTWTLVADSTFGRSDIFAITYGGGRFVAVGDDGKIAYCNY